MNPRTHRLRRVAAAAALGVGAVGSVVGLAAGTAGATTTAYSAKLSATSKTINGNGSGQPAGTITISTMQATGPSDVITLTTSGTGTTDWTTATVTGSNVVASLTSTTTGLKTTALHIKVTRVAGETGSVVVHNITYLTTGVTGTVKVTATSSTVTTKDYTFHPATVVNATAGAAAPGAAPTGSLTTTGATGIGRGPDQAAGTLKVGLASTTSSATTAKTEGWTTGTSVTLEVAPTGTQCSAASTHFVLFTGTPTVSVSSATVSTTPRASVSLLTTSPCNGVSRNEAKVTFTNSGTFTGKGGSITVTLSGIKYNVGTQTTSGNVTVTEVAHTGITTFSPASAVNAKIQTLSVTANSPAVTVAKTAYDASISPITIAEQSNGAVSSPYVCISLTTGTFNPTATATAKVTKGNAVVTSTVVYKNAAGAAATSTAAKYAIVHVKTASTKEMSTFQVSGLAVNAGSASGTVSAVVTMGSSSTDCTTNTTSVGRAVAFTVGTSSTQIYGATAAATAAKLLETTFPSNDTSSTCIAGTAGTTSSATRPVILATETHFPDALSSQYLAGYLKTGTLLTPTTSLSTVTKAALRTTGATRVVVVGGPLAVTTTVVNALKATPAYACGGGSVLATRDLTVTRIYGQTQYETAMDIAENVPSGYVASAKFINAYSGTNATKGTGMYNDTAGTGSATPATSGTMRTAILASGTEFQDAMASSALAYRGNGSGVGHQTAGDNGFPVVLTAATSLTTAAKSAIENLTIKQVIVMGGQLAISNTVTKALETMGISVLRVAGKNYTDTAVQFAKFLVNTGTKGMGWSLSATHMVTVTRGNGFTDGLAGAVVSGTREWPLLLTNSPTTVGTYLTAFLKASGKTTKGVDSPTRSTQQIEKLTVFGGPLAVSPAVIQKMETDIS